MLLHRSTARQLDTHVFDGKEFNAIAQLACSQAINETLPHNPAGLVICYNVANVSKISGIFSADIRVYAAHEWTLSKNTSVVLDINFSNAGSIKSLNSTQQIMNSVLRRDSVEDSSTVIQDTHLAVGHLSTSDHGALNDDTIPRALHLLAENTASQASVQGSAMIQLTNSGASMPMEAKDSHTQPGDALLGTRHSPGSVAGMASPSPDLRRIKESPVEASGAKIVPAIIPRYGGQHTGPQSMQASAANATRASDSPSTIAGQAKDMLKQTTNSSLELQTSIVTEIETSDLAETVNSTSLSPIVFSPQWQTGQEIANVQMVVQLDLELANTNPTDAGVYGSLLPQFTMRIAANATEAAQVLDMRQSTMAYLVGIKGSSIPVGTFVFPGRSFLGQDGSVDRIGLFAVSIYIVLFVGTMIVGMGTRLHMRRQYRRKTRYRR